MFAFWKRKDRSVQTPPLEIDLHSHFIPAVDDGAKTMAESIMLLGKMEALGYKKVITTPHIMSDTYKNTPDTIHDGLDKLRSEAKRNGLSIQIDAAAEYYLDDGFPALLKHGEMMTFNGRYLLFETSYVSKPMQTEDMIFAIVSEGYIPVMAHPERYRYIKDPLKEYSRLKELGVLFQVNLNSFGGHYGRLARERVHFLSRNGFIDFLGSDIHTLKQVECLESVFASDSYKEIYRYNTVLNHTLK